MFNFEEDYVLRNEIVELSPLLSAHEIPLFAVANNIEIWEHFEENGYGKENFSNYIKLALQKRKAKEEYPFIIRDLRSNEFAGLTRSTRSIII